MPHAYEGRIKGKRSERWTAYEDFILENLIGTASFSQIALRLGRAPSAVQRRASLKGWSARDSWRQDKKIRAAQAKERLMATEEDLAEFL